MINHIGLSIIKIKIIELLLLCLNIRHLYALVGFLVSEASCCFTVAIFHTISHHLDTRKEKPKIAPKVAPHWWACAVSFSLAIGCGI